MVQIEIDYQELENEFINTLSDLGTEDIHSERGVLATSLNDNVSARRMRLLSNGLTFYAWANRYARKTEQILQNPKVSVVVEYIQIDGNASVMGHPTETPEFLEAIKKKLPHRYESLTANWRSIKDRVALKIMSTRVALYKYGDLGGLHILDVEGKKAYRIQDSDISSRQMDAPIYRKR